MDTKNYKDTKDNKNILVVEMEKCLNQNDLSNNPNNANIFVINLILLCVAIDTTNDLNEKEKIEIQLQHFIIFCILASVNINEMNNHFFKMQTKLYDLIGFGLIFLRQRDDEKYKELLKYLITPIFEDINYDQNKGSFFGGPKRNKYMNTAVCKLFVYSIIDDNQKEDLNRSVRAPTLVNRRRNFAMVDKNYDNLCYTYKDDSSRNDKKKKDKKKSSIHVSFQGELGKLSQNIFQNTLDFYKKLRKQTCEDNIFLFYNNYDKNNCLNKISNTVKNEKSRINQCISEIIPKFGDKIKKYSITIGLDERKRRKIYKKYKKLLFSWNGFWADKNLFYNHPEYLKLKLKNHFTKEMTKIILTPILDIDYYIPQFSRFDKNKLFNKEDYKYKIHLDIDNILNDYNNNNMIVEDEIKNIFNDLGDEFGNCADAVNSNNIINDNDDFNYDNIKKSKKNSEFTSTINVQGFNYLESAYKLQYLELWSKYLKIYNKNFVFDDIEIKSKDIYDNLLRAKIKFC